MYQKPNVFLPFIVEEIKKGGVEDSDIFFLCALGSHRKQTEEATFRQPLFYSLNFKLTV